MAQYLIMIYEVEAEWATATPETFKQMMDAHNNFPGQVAALGATVVSGNALQPTTTATTIRSDVVSDGPFVETKEALGGYYLMEADDLDAALEIAARIPAARMGGAVEVRSVVER